MQCLDEPLLLIPHIKIYAVHKDGMMNGQRTKRESFEKIFS